MNVNNKKMKLSMNSLFVYIHPIHVLVVPFEWGSEIGQENE
jgi:hypothetical protein